MPRPTTKDDLLAAAQENYEKLNTLISKNVRERFLFRDRLQRFSYSL